MFMKKKLYIPELMREQLILLISIYNDWKSLNILIKNLIKKLFYKNIFLIIINDGSTKKSYILKKYLPFFFKIKILNLKKNFGSQKAFAIGLYYIYKKFTQSKIILMDGDGEDNPEVIKDILELSKNNPNKIITVFRTIRKENIILKLFYEIYFLLNIILTHKIIRFGNFSLIKSINLKRIFNNKDIWLAYPSAVIKSEIKLKNIYKPKEYRYSGYSQMSYIKLLYHSLKIIAVFRTRVLTNLCFYNFLLLFLFKNNLPFFLFFFFSIIFILSLYLIYEFEIRKRPKRILDEISSINIIK